MEVEEGSTIKILLDTHWVKRETCLYKELLHLSMKLEVY